MATHFEARRRFEEELAQARDRAHEQEAGDLLIAAGWNGLEVVEALADDDRMWKRLARDPRPLDDGDLARLLEVLDSGWAGLLDELGYVPPPEAQELADQLLGGLVQLVAAPDDLDLLKQDVAAIRADLAQFAAELRAVLLLARDIPRGLRARTVRGPVGELADVLRLTVPVAIAGAAVSQVPIVGPLAVGVVNRGLDTMRARRRKRTIAEWETVAARAMSAVADAVEEGEDESAIDVEAALGAAWRADAAMRRIAMADEEPAGARESLALLREVRDRLVDGRVIGPELVDALRGWRDLREGRTDEVRREERMRDRRAALRERGARAPRLSDGGRTDKPPADEGEAPDDDDQGPRRPPGA